MIEADKTIFPRSDFVTLKELTTIISNLKEKKAPGVDMISNLLIKKFLNLLFFFWSKYLIHVLNVFISLSNILAFTLIQN